MAATGAAQRGRGRLADEREALNRALDRLEEELVELEEQIEQARREVQGLVPGHKVQWRYVRCGRKGCRCQEGQGHGPYAYIAHKEGAG